MRLQRLAYACALVLACAHCDNGCTTLEVSPSSGRACVGAEVAFRWRTSDVSLDAVAARASRPGLSFEGSDVPIDVSTHEAGVVVDDDVPYTSSGTFHLRCSEPGTIELELFVTSTRYDARGMRVPEERIDVHTFTIVCEDCGMPDPNPVNDFFGQLIPDTLDDLFDSVGASAARREASIDETTNGSEQETFDGAEVEEAFNGVTAPHACGADADGELTVCTPDALTMPEGDVYTVLMEVREPPPMASPDSDYVFSAVFDSDGDPANDLVPLPEFPWDSYQSTDKWFELVYDHTTMMWTLRVTQLGSTGARTSVPSSARAVLDGNQVRFYIPQSELPAMVPTYRLTSFVHDGMYTMATRAVDVSLGNPTLSLFPLACDFTGIECSVTGGPDGALESCGPGDECVSTTVDDARGVCMPMGTMPCDAGTCPASEEHCVIERGGVASHCVSTAELYCLCAGAAGKHVLPTCIP